MKLEVQSAIILAFIGACLGLRYSPMEPIDSIEPMPFKIHPRRTVCSNSFDCGAEQCCRDAQGTVIGALQEGFLDFILVPQTGVCSATLGSEGELCDFKCGCQRGLTCYRPMSGVCCQPRKCMDAVYVQRQIDYWANCHKNPFCHFPV